MGAAVISYCKLLSAQTYTRVGTSLGISTAYMAMANPQAQVVTAEGSAAVAAQAKHNFQSLQLSSIKQVLPVISMKPCLAYWLHCRSSIWLLSMAITGMNQLYAISTSFCPICTNPAWLSLTTFTGAPKWKRPGTAIKEHPAVSLSIDLFFIGLVFFSDQFKIKQHFTIRF